MRAAGLVALYVAASAAALDLIQVRPYAVFQHFAPWSELLSQHPLSFGVIVAQTMICLAVAGPARLAALVRGAFGIAGPWRALVVLGLLTFSLTVPAESVERFAGEVVFAGWVAAAAALNLWLVACAIQPGALGRARDAVGARITIERGAAAPRPWDRHLPWVLAAAVFATCALIAAFVFERVPHIDDSVMYLFQAKYMAMGRVHVPCPPDIESFGEAHMVCDPEKWYGKFFPGWPAVLSLGVRAGAPWLVNPLLGALAIPLTHALVLRLHDRATANAAAVLLAVSPWLVFTSSEMMAHAVVLDFALLALLALEIQRDRPAGVWSLVAGASLGAVFFCRPFDAMLLGPVAALWAFGLNGRRLSIVSLALVAASAAGVASLTFAYQSAVTGDAMLSPHQLWAETMFGPGVDVLGFGEKVGIPLWSNVDPLPGHGAADVVLNANKNFYLIGFELFGWAAGSLLFAALGCLLGPRERGDRLSLALCASVIGGHCGYWAAGGPDFGARYWYLVLVPFVILTVRGGQILAARLAVAGAGADGGTRVAVAVVVASATAIACVVPWRCVTKYHRYRDIGGDVRELAADGRFDGALVFVRAPNRSDYQSAFIFNSPLLDGPGAVYARDAGPAQRAAVVARYPERPIWVIGRSETSGTRIVVLGGPLPKGVVPELAPYDYAHPLQAIVR